MRVAALDLVRVEFASVRPVLIALSLRFTLETCFLSFPLFGKKLNEKEAHSFRAQLSLPPVQITAADLFARREQLGGAVDGLAVVVAACRHTGRTTRRRLLDVEIWCNSRLRRRKRNARVRATDDEVVPAAGGSEGRRAGRRGGRSVVLGRLIARELTLLAVATATNPHALK